MNTPDTEVEIEQNAETGEVLTANGVNLTPDTEWRERLWEWVETAPSGVEVLNCYPESVVAIIEQALSSRDTYWKERVRKEVEGIKEQILCQGCDNELEYCDCTRNEILDTLLDNLK